MEYISIINGFLIILITSLITGNNSATITGPFTSIPPMKKLITVLVVSGMSAGLLLEGHKLSGFTTIYYSGDQISLISIFISTILIIYLANRFRTPISLTMILAGGIIGIGLIEHIEVTKFSHLLYLASIWIIYPFIGFIVSGITYKKILDIPKRDIWRGYIFLKILLLISTTFLAYVFGANTIGLIYTFTDMSITYQLIFVISIIIGVIIFSRETSLEIGLNIYNVGMMSLFISQIITIILIEIATQLSIPVSLTQLLMISLVGPGTYREFKIINIKYIKRIIAVWIGSPIIGYTLTILVYLLIKAIIPL
jgi:phosphate/sulfate permease